MKKKLPLLLIVGALLGVSVTASHAAPHSQYHLTTVSWVVATRDDLDEDDRYVTLIGHVTGRTGDETYFFTDGTGRVRLDSADFKLPVGPKIVVGGRIDQAYLGFGHLEVDVRSWHYAKKP
jgi:uncharacterized protein YdeI (BOF family)